MAHWRRAGALLTVVGLMVLGGVPSVAPADPSTPPAGFADAVVSRVYLLSGHPNAPHPAGTPSWASLQQQVGEVATHSGGSQSSTVVDPENGGVWDLPTLLQRASGRDSWLGDDASPDERKLQLTQVVGKLVWRLAKRAGYGPDELAVSRSMQVTTDAMCTADAPGVNNHYTASPALVSLWDQLLSQAYAGTTPGHYGLPVGTEATWYRNNSGINYATASVGRMIFRADLPASATADKPADLGAPFPGVGVDAARLLAEEITPQAGSNQPLSVGLGHAERGAAVTNDDFGAAPAFLGTVTPALDPRYQGPNLYLAAYDFDPALMLAAGADATHAEFLPALKLEVLGEEPPPGFPPSAVTGQFDSSGDSCGRYWGSNLNHVAVLFREALPPLEGYRLDVSVVDQDGKGIANVRLSFNKTSRTAIPDPITDSAGGYRADGLEAGTYSISPQSSGDGQPPGGQYINRTCDPGGVVDRKDPAKEICSVPVGPGAPAVAEFVYRLPDLVAERLEITQGIQADPWSQAAGPLAVSRVGDTVPSGTYKGVPLVDGVRTVARLYASVAPRPLAVPVPGVTAVLRGYRKNGSGALEELDGSPLSPLPVGGTAARDLAVGDSLPLARLLPLGAYTFDVPAAWTTGEVTFVGEVDPPPHRGAPYFDNGPRPIPECIGCEINSAVALAAVVYHRVAKVVIDPIQISYRYPGRPGAIAGPDRSVDYRRIRDVLPIPPGAFDVRPYPAAIADITTTIKALHGRYGLTKANLSDCLANCAAFLETAEVVLVRNLATDLGSRHFAVGSLGIQGTSFTVIEQHTSILTMKPIPRPLTSVGHELGHLLGLPHASNACGGGAAGQVGEGWPPDEQGYIQGVGLDRRPGSGAAAGPYKLMAPGVGAPQWFDLMSYCTNASDAIAWISTRNWTRLVLEGEKAFAAQASRAGTAPPAAGLVVDAAVLPSGGVELVDVHHEPARRTPSVTGAPYAIVTRDAHGRVRSRTLVAADPLVGVDGSLVHAVVPAAGVTGVEIVRAGRILAKRTARRRPPKLRILAPGRTARLRTTKPFKVRWRIRSAGAVQSRLDYSSDGGRSWRPLAVGVPGAKVTLPGTLLTPSRQARLRVVVNDGFNDTVAKSARFRVIAG